MYNEFLLVFSSRLLASLTLGEAEVLINDLANHVSEAMSKADINHLWISSVLCHKADAALEGRSLTLLRDVAKKNPSRRFVRLRSDDKRKDTTGWLRDRVRTAKRCIGKRLRVADFVMRTESNSVTG